MGHRLHASGDMQSLLPLVEKTSMLHYDATGRVRCSEKIDTPTDEYGIPRRVELMRHVLDTLDVEHRWTGEYDLHHVAWPGEAYRRLNDAYGDEASSYYRGAPSLKVILPRQLHNYVHAITREPPMPPHDVMAQYALEHGQVRRLFDTVRVTSFEKYPELASLPFPEQERRRTRSLHRKVEAMEDGEIGIMPNRGLLSRMQAAEARIALRGIARTRSLTNEKRSQRSFFAAA